MIPLHRQGDPLAARSNVNAVHRADNWLEYSGSRSEMSVAPRSPTITSAIAASSTRQSDGFGEQRPAAAP